MDAQNLLTASVLDIVFEGRNKEYGAYVLRKGYDRRLYTALAITGSLIVLLLIVYYSGTGNESTINGTSFKQPVELERVSINEPAKVEQPRITLPKPAAQPRIRTIRVNIPVIVKDPPRQEMPPENALIENAKIGNITQDGDASNDIVPPQGSSNGVTGQREKPTIEEDKIFTVVEIESTYPGGPESWKRFLLKTFRYPTQAQEANVQGTMVVQFIVDVSGSVSEVNVISGPEELRNEAIGVIKKSGTWIPAIQNGRKVKSYKKQPITFRLADE
ncbi:MAG: TonB family protein [Chitinophagaceae bacterium]|nr:TonB family protein [Chitinophagaceae bacterium]